MSNDDTMLDQLVRLIPGYGAYREQESRREDDRRTRAFLAQRLADGKARLDAAGKSAVAKGDLDTPAVLESIRSRIDLAQNRLTAAVEGYAGWFSDRQVDTELLEEIGKLDANLVSLVDQIDDLGKALLATDDRDTTQLSQAADLLNSRIDRRTELLQAGS